MGKVRIQKVDGVEMSVTVLDEDEVVESAAESRRDEIEAGGGVADIGAMLTLRKKATGDRDKDFEIAVAWVREFLERERAFEKHPNDTRDIVIEEALREEKLLPRKWYARVLDLVKGKPARRTYAHRDRCFVRAVFVIDAVFDSIKPDHRANTKEPKSACAAVAEAAAGHHTTERAVLNAWKRRAAWPDIGFATTVAATGFAPIQRLTPKELAALKAKLEELEKAD